MYLVQTVTESDKKGERCAAYGKLLFIHGTDVSWHCRFLHIILWLGKMISRIEGIVNQMNLGYVSHDS